MTCGGFFDVEKLTQRHHELEKQMQATDFWNDQHNAKKVTKEMSIIKSEIEKVKKITQLKEDLQTYLVILEEEFSDSLLTEAVELFQREKDFIEQTEIQILLNGKYDFNNALLTVHPGAGGTESQDWGDMLLRMYKYWAENAKFGFKLIDYLPGDVAGLKSATVEITGDFAYGYLKSEAGIHRLVRISPFNAQGKRQTSFVSIFVYPMLDDDLEFEINPADLKIDTYRASGAGGQHVNTTDSAVRITHLPTNTVAQCQNERSQIQNKEKAMSILKAKLYIHYEAEREKERQKHESTKTNIDFGNQIRSYIFQPYQLVKDHRTNYETGQVGNVMDGEINGFINAWLHWAVEG
jgi:peptide chain release factor 2